MVKVVSIFQTYFMVYRRSHIEVIRSMCSHISVFNEIQIYCSRFKQVFFTVALPSVPFQL